MQVKFDSPEWHKIRRRSNVVAALNWSGGVPVLALMPYPARMGGAGFLILQDQVRHYVDEQGNPTIRLTATAAKAAKQMALEATPHQLTVITDAIIESAADLRAMPMRAKEQVH